MTLRLHLGVIDVPYSDKSGQTTGDVAEILEAKYHPLEIFYETHKQDIANDLADGLTKTLESMISGAPVNPDDVFLAGTSRIDTRMKDFILTGEMEALGIPGVPTAASGKTSLRKGGINHRLKHPYAQGNPQRQSLIDTGLYESSLKSWVEAVDYAAMGASAYQGSGL